ncbi:hypothetical protein [Gordonia soli]|uniref:Polysaccharide biosynthesis protein n=1 Tax=Gordonia soli NBRC 108243 TaxID=1223545 RepID=M0QM56_9ACTN|nr:hypothetical protein [Gordonia soli]GAC68477.1 hypothetical protein GS4_16_00060 [Gordonia soli NBRC 108243]
MIRGKGVRLVYGAVDQSIVSFTSFVLLIVGAQFLAPVDLGVLATAMVFYQVMIAVARAVTGEPLLVLRWTDPAREADVRRSMMGASLLGSLPIAGVGAVMLMTASNSLVEAVGVCLAFAPVILAYDALRFDYISRLENRALSGIDGGVALCQCIGMAIALHFGSAPPLALAIALAPQSVPLAIYFTRSRPRRTDLRTWFTAARRYAPSFLYESVWGALLQWFLVFFVVIFAGLAEAAAFRAIVVVFGVTNVVTNYLRSTALSHITRRGELTAHSARLDAVWMAMAITLTVGASMVALLAIPDSWGHRILGDTWSMATEFVVVGALARVSAAFEAIPGVLLRAVRETWSVVCVRTAVGLAALVVCPLTVAIGGVAMGFVSLAVMSWVLTLSLSVLLWRSLAHRHPTPDSTDVGPVDDHPLQQEVSRVSEPSSARNAQHR